MATAAVELGISESALSRSISRLERQYGVQLFDRVGRGVRLNGYGRLLLRHSERAFNELDFCEQQIRTLRAGADQVSIGFIPSLGTTVVPAFLHTAMRDQPNLQLRLQEGRGPALRMMLLNGEIDLYVGTLLFPDPAIEWELAWEEGVVALMRSDHALAKRTDIELNDLAQERWLVARSAGTTRRALVEAARNAGFIANVAFESDDFATIVGLIGVGYGVGLLPEHAAPARDSLVAIPIRSGPRRNIGVGQSRARPLGSAASVVRTLIIGQVLRSVPR